jgi:hypothetical protein
MVVLVPVPVEVIAPGVLVNVQVPVPGKPLNTTLPVATLHVGWVIVPTTGAVGVAGWALITTFPDEGEVQPTASVTVYVYVPAASPLIVVLVPVPGVVVPPGDLVSVHAPDAGKPLKTTLPVATLQVGCVIVPTVGAEGAFGTALITTFPDDGEVHPDALVTV